MAKFYVATKWADRLLANEVITMLISIGHKITCDWTDHCYSEIMDNKERLKKRLLWSIEDIKGASEADILVFLAINQHEYKGAYVEMGCALGNNHQVCVIGHNIDSCIFTENPSVIVFDTLEDFYDYLEDDNVSLFKG